jgi:peptidoglycan/LPS O-acetylase OafA/YrhL
VTRRVGAIAGLVAGPFFLISVELNTWASIDYLHGLGWEFVGGGQVPWPSSLARGPYGWAQVATFVVTGLLIVVLAAAVRSELPPRRTSSFAVVLLALLGVALVLAAFGVDTPMLSGGKS